MTHKRFRQIYERLPVQIANNQSLLGEYLGRNKISVSGYCTGRSGDIPTEIANLMICLDRLHKAGLLDNILPHLERKISLLD